MKIAARDIEPLLQAPDARFRAALIYGPDAGLVRERAQRIKSRVLAESGDPFAFVELTEDVLIADPARLADEILAIGLLSSKRLVMIRDAGDKLASLIESVSPSLHEGVFLMVTADELSARSGLRGWFESYPQAASIACYRDEARDIQAIVNQSFSSSTLTAGRDVIEYLCAQLGNDREVTRSELEKIIIYAGEEKTLTLEDAQALVDYNRDTQLDDIVNAAADKNIQTLDKMLAVHSREGMPPVAYLRALQHYFNRLYYVKSRALAGYDIEATVQNLKPKVFFKQAPLMIRHARNWDLPKIVRALKLLVAAELAGKTSDIPAVAASTRRLFQLTQLR